MTIIQELELGINFLDIGDNRQKTGYSGRLYPNGEFSMGRIPKKKVSRKERLFDAALRGQNDFPLRANSLQLGDYERVEEFWSGAPSENSAPLALSYLINSHKDDPLVRKPRGQGGISSLGRRSIRSGSYLLQQKYGKDKLALLTVTLPSFEGREDIVCLLCAEWSELVRCFLQEVGREYERQTGNKFCFVGCTEIQEKRYEKYGHPCPHLHIVYVACQKRGNWIISANKFRELWKRIIDNRLKALTGEDFFDDAISQGRIDCQPIKKSAEGYIGKYLSKGSSICDRLIEDGYGSLIPCAWWHCSLKLKRAIRSLTSEIPSDYKFALLDRVDLVSMGVATWTKEIVIGGFFLGFIGKIPGLGIEESELRGIELS